MQTKPVVIRTYISNIEIVRLDDERCRVQDQLRAALYAIIEKLLAETGLKRYIGYLFLRVEFGAYVFLNDRTDPAEIVDFITQLMLRAQGGPLDGRLRIALHPEHNYKIPSEGIEVDLPNPGGIWAANIRRSTEPNQVLLSKMLWLELCDIERLKSRMVFKKTHQSMVFGVEEELFELEWAGETAQPLPLFPQPPESPW